MRFKVAAVQAAPVYLKREATIQKVGDLAADAANSGVSLAVFPEAFVPTYPDWIWRMKPGDPLGEELFALLADQSVRVPSAATEALGAIARKTKLYLVIGVNERDVEGRAATIYNTLLYFGPDGRLLGKHRKLMPTSPERMVWGFGDGSTLLGVYATPFGRLGVCSAGRITCRSPGRPSMIRAWISGVRLLGIGVRPGSRRCAISPARGGSSSWAWRSPTTRGSFLTKRPAESNYGARRAGFVREARRLLIRTGRCLPAQSWNARKSWWRRSTIA